DTGGNPYFVLEMLSALVADGLLVMQNGHWETNATALALPQNLREAVRRRLAMLPPASIELLRVAAVLGDSFDYTLLRTAAGGAEIDVLAGLDPLIMSHLLRDAPDGSGSGIRISFQEKATRAVVLEDLSLPRRQALHRAAAEALKARSSKRPGDSVELAVHYREAGETEEAVTHLLQAAMSAADAFAWQAAASLFEDARKLSTTPLSEAHRLRVMQIWLELGRPDDVETEGEALLKMANLSHLGRARTLKLMAQAAVDRGRTTEAHQLFRRALSAAGMKVPGNWLSKVLAPLTAPLPLLGEFTRIATGGEARFRDTAPSAEEQELMELAHDLTQLRHVGSEEIIQDRDFIRLQMFCRAHLAARSLRRRSPVMMAETYAMFAVLSKIFPPLEHSTGRFLAAAARCLEHCDSATRVRTFYIMVGACYLGETFAVARPYLLDWYDTAKRRSSAHDQAHAATWLGLLYWHLGRLDEGMRCMQEVAELPLRSLETKRTLRAVELLLRSARGEAVQEAWLEARNALGPQSEMLTWIALGWAGYHLGELTEALRIFSTPRPTDAPVSPMGPGFAALVLMEVVETGQASWQSERAQVTSWIRQADRERYKRRPIMAGMRQVAHARRQALDGNQEAAKPAFQKARHDCQAQELRMFEALVVTWGARHGAFTDEEARMVRAAAELP
ncbi:MAG: ATP-binding protein, partial [Candidatus Xenobia bacterium]